MAARTSNRPRKEKTTMSVDASSSRNDHIGSPNDQIGETAGLVWHYLASKGKVNMTTLIRDLKAHRDLTMQAIGWLAREHKVVIVEEKKKKMIALTHH
jgi:hypothetical protein